MNDELLVSTWLDYNKSRARSNLCKFLEPYTHMIHAWEDCQELDLLLEMLGENISVAIKLLTVIAAKQENTEVLVCIGDLQRWLLEDPETQDLYPHPLGTCLRYQLDNLHNQANPVIRCIADFFSPAGGKLIDEVVHYARVAQITDEEIIQVVKAVNPFRG